MKKISEESFNEVITIVQSDINAHLLPLSEETSSLTNKNIKSFKNSDNFVNKFLPKAMSSHSHSFSMMHDRINSSDEEDNEDEKLDEKIFDKSTEGWILRKILFINESSDHIRLVIKFDGPDSNLHLPEGLISF